MERARTWLPRVAAAAAFAMYALAAPPGLYWLDSGELGSAAVRLGSPHPTGFPLYCVLAKAATLVPLGDVAFRLNLMSAACGALAVLWVSRFVVESCREDVPALVGAGAAAGTLAVSAVFFRNATVAEVYAPTAALIALTLLLYGRIARGAGSATGLVAAVVAGLGIATHVSYLLVALPLAVIMLVRLYRGARWPLVAPVLALGVAAAMYAYLPVRSATGREVAVDWDHPRTLAGLWTHVRAARIRTAFADEMFSTTPEVLAVNARRVADDAADDLGPIALVAAAAGLFWLGVRRRERWVGAALAAVAAGDFVYAVWVNPMGQVDLQNGIPLAIAVSAAAGVGVAWFARFLGRAGPYAGVFAGVLLILPPALVGWRARWAAAAGDLPQQWAEAALAATPPRGIILAMNDSTAAGLMFATQAEGERPDVAALVRQEIRGDIERTRALVRRTDARPAPVSARDPLGSILARGRPITWEIGSDAPPRSRRLIAGAPLCRLASARVAPPGGDVGDAIASLRDLFSGRDADDAEARAMQASALTGLGRLALSRGQAAIAGRLFEAATEVRPEDAPAYVNRGVVLARAGRFAEAARVTERALAISPNLVVALADAARYRMQLGQDAAAKRHIARALVLAPRRAEVWALAGILDARAGRFARARKRIERALALDPDDPDARATLSKLPPASRK